MSAEANVISCVNPFWPRDKIWRQRSWSTLARVIAWCLTAPSNYQTNVDYSVARFCGIHYFTASSPATIQCDKITNYPFKISDKSHRDRTNNGSDESFVVILQLWPLLLTWFNFNPSMDK